MVDSEMVAENLGMEIKRKGKRKSILCPSHDDRNFGSCILTERGYRCFACGMNGDIFQMVQAYLNCDFLEAVKKVAEIAGVKIEEIEESGAYISVLKPSERQLIGLHVSPIKHVIQIGKDIESEEKNEITIDNPEKETLVELKTIINNPLIELKRDNEDLYNQIVINHCKDAIDKRRRMIKAVQNPHPLPSIEQATEENIEDWVYGWAFSQIKNDIPQNEIIAFLNQEITDIQHIAVRHGGLTPQNIATSAGISLGQTLCSKDVF